jgi:hypothetical protein
VFVRAARDRLAASIDKEGESDRGNPSLKFNPFVRMTNIKGCSLFTRIRLGGLRGSSSSKELEFEVRLTTGSFEALDSGRTTSAALLCNALSNDEEGRRGMGASKLTVLLDGFICGGRLEVDVEV